MKKKGPPLPGGRAAGPVSRRDQWRTFGCRWPKAMGVAFDEAGVRDAPWFCGGVAWGCDAGWAGVCDDPPGLEVDPPGVDGFDEPPPPCLALITAITASAALGASGRPSGPHNTPLMMRTPLGSAIPPLPPP